MSLLTAAAALMTCVAVALAALVSGLRSFHA
jgi:hypothetical protein